MLGTKGKQKSLKDEAADLKSITLEEKFRAGWKNRKGGGPFQNKEKRKRQIRPSLVLKRERITANPART